MFKVIDWAGKEIKSVGIDFLFDADALAETDYLRSICRIVEA